MTNTILGALVNGAIAGALLAAAVSSDCFCLPRGILSAAARYVVWWVALVAALLLPLAYLPTPSARHAYAASHRAAPIGQPSPTASASISRVALPSAHKPVPVVHLRFPLVVAVGGWSRWIPIAWACLSGFMLLRLLSSCILLDRRKSGAVAAPDRLVNRVGGIAREARIDAPSSDIALGEDRYADAGWLAAAGHSNSRAAVCRADRRGVDPDWVA